MNGTTVAGERFDASGFRTGTGHSVVWECFWGTPAHSARAVACHGIARPQKLLD